MRALSLEYHDVLSAADASSGYPGPGPASYKVSLEAFEQHLDAIGRSGAAKPSRAVDWVRAATASRPLFLTFDDGGRSAYTCIAPALERRGWRGHFFVTGDRIGTPGFLSPDQIRALHRRGHVIGSHSMTHPLRMGGCSTDRLADEWQRSCDALALVLGEHVTTASVPGGFYTPPVAETAAAAGIRILFTSSPTTRCHLVAGCTVIGRYTIRRWTTASTASALAAGAPVPRSMQWALYSGLTVVRAVAGDRYTRVRQLFWASRA